MGTKIAIAETFSASTGKKLKVDAVLPAGLGALLLLDTNHRAAPIAAWGTGNVLVPNVALADAQAMTGGGDATTLGVLFANNAGGVAGVGRERSLKGGFHGAPRQDGGVPNIQGYGGTMGSALAAYLRANPNNDYYISMWERITRAQAVASSLFPHASVSGSAGATSNYLFDADGLGWRGKEHNLIGTWLGSRNSQSPNAEGLLMRNIGTTAFIGSTTGLAGYVGSWGAMPAPFSGLGGANNAAMASFILYRFYMEDLTVSGRTYAEVDALDYALYQEAFAAGGRFYGDTWTAPATLAGA